MTLGALLAIIGVILAIYALARPPQRKSIGLFVRLWVVIVGLSISGLLLLSLEILVQYEARAPGWKSALGAMAFLIPIAVTVWAVLSWHRARLTKKSEPKFRDFLLSCIRDGEYDEAVRILTRNQGDLAKILTKDTAGLIFDRHFIRALMSARSWLHLELLTDSKLIELLPNPLVARDATIRQMASQDESPLHARVAHMQGCDETSYCPESEWDLIERTFGNPEWYLQSHAGYPVLMTAIERLDSGEFDTAYNRNDLLYIATQGVSSRARCPVHLAWKTVVLAINAVIEHDKNSDFYVTDLGDLFVAAYEHSKHNIVVWNDPPSGCGEFPTPFAYIMSGICLDLKSLDRDAFRRSKGGTTKSGQVAAAIGMTWTRCIMYMLDDDNHVPEQFRVRLLRDYFEHLLQRKGDCEARPADGSQPLSDWYEILIKPFHMMCRKDDPQVSELLKVAVHGLDIGKPDVLNGQDWLCAELGIPPRPMPTN